MSLNPDVILTRGKIVTVDSRFTVAEAFALRRGVIEAVGSAAEIEITRRAGHPGRRHLLPAAPAGQAGSLRLIP